MSDRDIHTTGVTATTLQMASEKFRKVSSHRLQREFPVAEICVVGSAFAIFFATVGTVMVILHYTLESRANFHSLAEHYNIQTNILGFVFLGVALGVPIISWMAYLVARAITIVEMANRYQECEGLCEDLRQSFRSQLPSKDYDGVHVVSMKYLERKEDIP